MRSRRPPSASAPITRASAAESWSFTEADGTRLGQQVTPLDRVGIYVPGGKAAYPSSVLMNALPAKVAGVREIVMVVPTPNGAKTRWCWPRRISPASPSVHDRRRAGDRGARVSARRPIARSTRSWARATRTSPRRSGSVFGVVGIDMVAGPSEDPGDRRRQRESGLGGDGSLFAGRARRGGAGDPAVARCGADRRGRGQHGDDSCRRCRAKKIIAASLRRRGALIRVRDLAEACAHRQPHRARASRARGRRARRAVAEDPQRRRDLRRALQLRGDRRLLRRPEPCAADRAQRALFVAARRVRFPEAHQRDRRIARGRAARSARSRQRSRAARACRRTPRAPSSGSIHERPSAWARCSGHRRRGRAAGDLRAIGLSRPLPPRHDQARRDGEPVSAAGRGRAALGARARATSRSTAIPTSPPTGVQARARGRADGIPDSRRCCSATARTS